MPIAGGETIYRAGDPPDGFYVVQEGTVMLFGGPPDQAHEPLGRLRSGDSFGESGLFDGHERSETARAEGAGALVRLDTSVLLAFLENQPLIAIKMQLAAARGHAVNVKTLFSLAKRWAVRYYVNKDIRLNDEDADSRQATLVDLSWLGVRIQGVVRAELESTSAKPPIEPIGSSAGKLSP
ncbi:MAG: cyclic nucleotide-binding domain-containing protein [bacterium]|nr:cyclic nucleotide-binding domain-containing protein [bacterium]